MIYIHVFENICWIMCRSRFSNRMYNSILVELQIFVQKVGKFC